MTNKLRSVTVHQFPARVTSTDSRRFLRDLQQYSATERPRIVLDCSELTRMDDAAVHLVLCCLEEAMKGNGDLKLASLSEESEAALHEAKVSRLFEMYPTPAAAISSFYGYANSTFNPVYTPADELLAPESAA